MNIREFSGIYGYVMLDNYTLTVKRLLQYGYLYLNTGTLRYEGTGYGVSGDFNDARFMEGTGTVFYDLGTEWPAASDTQVVVGPFTFYNLKFKNVPGFCNYIGRNGGDVTVKNNFEIVCPGCTDYGGWVHLDNNLYVDGDIIINSFADLDAEENDPGPTSRNIYLKGNWTNNGRFFQRNGTVTFNGTGDQNISGTTSTNFYNLTVNKTSGKVILNQDITIGSNDPQPVPERTNPTFTTFASSTAGALTLTNGALDLNSQKLTIANAAGTGIARTSGYIISEKTDNSSKVQWNSGTNADEHTIPFGKTNATYIPFSYTRTSGNLGNVIVSTFPTDAANLPLPATPDNVTNLAHNANDVADRFWQIDLAGSASPEATLVFSYSDDETPANGEDDLRAQRYSTATGTWQTITSGQTSNTADNTVTAPGITAFSPWKLVRNSAPLPVELLYFTGVLKGNNVLLQWFTSSEINNDFFTVLRSYDGKLFEEIGKVKGAGNSSESISYNFIDELPASNFRKELVYYRLCQTDFDGNQKCTSVIAVHLQHEKTIQVFPNPVIGKHFYIVCSEFCREENFVLTIRDVSGTAIFSEEILNASGNPIILSHLNISPGIYFLTLENPQVVFREKIAVVK